MCYYGFDLRLATGYGRQRRRSDGRAQRLVGERGARRVASQPVGVVRAVAEVRVLQRRGLHGGLQWRARRARATRTRRWRHRLRDWRARLLV
jgi:hypothetical protein